MNTEMTKMNLNIGGALIKITVPFSQQDFVRDVEEQVNNLYAKWRHEFQKKTDREILAMITYRYASAYYELSESMAKACEKAEECIRLAENQHESEDPGNAELPISGPYDPDLEV